jgi:hypothetical protein
MPTTMFDPQMEVNGQVVFEGEFNHVSIYQAPMIPGEVSNMVIDFTQSYKIDLEWQIDGVLWYVNSVLGGINPPVWHIHVYAERMGPGSDLQLYSGTSSAIILPSSQADLPVKYQVTLVPPGLPPHDPQSGMYRLCVVVHAECTRPGGTDIIGCYEGPMVLYKRP